MNEELYQWLIKHKYEIEYDVNTIGAAFNEILCSSAGKSLINLLANGEITDSENDCFLVEAACKYTIGKIALNVLEIEEMKNG